MKDAAEKKRGRNPFTHSCRRLVVLLDKSCQDTIFCRSVSALRTAKTADQLEQIVGSASWAPFLVSAGLATLSIDGGRFQNSYKLNEVGLKMARELFGIRESAIDYLRSREFRGAEEELAERDRSNALAVQIDGGSYTLILGRAFKDWLSKRHSE